MAIEYTEEWSRDGRSVAAISVDDHGVVQVSIEILRVLLTDAGYKPLER